MIVDNYATHSHPEVQKWLARHPRFVMHFTPTNAAWPRYRPLEARLERDVKAFVPDSASVQAAGLRHFGGWVW